MHQILGVVGSTTFAASHCGTGVPRVAVVVLVCSVIFVATHRLATVPGITAVVVAPPWIELVVAFPGVVVDLSLLPEFSDLSWSGGIDRGSRHGAAVGVLFGAEGIGGRSGNLDGEFVAFLGGFLCNGPPSVQCPHLGHSVHCIVRGIGSIIACSISALLSVGLSTLLSPGFCRTNVIVSIAVMMILKAAMAVNS